MPSHIRTAFDELKAMLSTFSRASSAGLYRWLLVLPGMLLCLGLALTYGLQHAAREAEQQVRQAEFEHHVNEVVASITQRLHSYEQVLNGTAGLFSVSADVSASTFAAYVRGLKLEEQLPGIQGVGFAQLIRPEEKQQHIAQVQASGRGYYQIRPAGQRQLYSSVVYLEPAYWRNQRAIGYDMYADPVRRSAMQRARDEGTAWISAKVRLVQETEHNAQPGFLMYVPIYRPGSPLQTAEQRREQTLGWAYAAFRMNDFLQGILGPHLGEIGTVVDLEIYDGSTPAESNRLFDSNSRTDRADASLKAIRQIAPLGHTWTLAIGSLAAFDARWNNDKPLIITLTGTLISLLAALLISLLVLARARAITSTQSMTLDLQESRQQLVEAQRISGLGVWIGDARSMSMRGTEHFSRILGLAPGDRSMGLRQLVIDEDQPLLQAAFDAVLAGGRQDVELRIKRCSDGALRHVQVSGELSQRSVEGARQLIGVIRDITEAKQIEKRLIDSERQFRQLVELLPEGLLIHYKWRVLFANPAAAKLLGAASPSQLLGEDFFQLIDPISQESVKDRLGKIIDQPDYVPTFLPRRMRRLDGSRVEVEAAAQRFILGGKDCIQVVIRDVTEHRQLQVDLESANLRSQRVSNELIEAQEAERRHLARELHDDVGQLLTFIKISASSLGRKLQGEQAQSLETLTDIAAEALSKVRNISRTLRPAQLDALGLHAAIGWQLETFLTSADLSWHLAAETLEPRPAPAVEIALFRIFQEALSNVLKHAQARHVEVSLGREHGYLYLSVRDNGRGFDQAEVLLQGQGIGLLSMSERAKLVGGELLVISFPRQGTEIKAQLREENE